MTNDENKEDQTVALSEIEAKNTPSEQSTRTQHAEQSNLQLPEQAQIANEKTLVSNNLPEMENPKLFPPPANVYFGTTNQSIQCPHCGFQGETMVERVPGFGTWLLCCALCCVSGICGPCVFCCDSTMDVVHSCPNCDHQLGSKTLV